MPSQLRNLRAFAFLIFAISVIVAVLANIVTFAPRTIQVIGSEGGLIGRGIIPHNYSAGIFWAVLFAFLSGVQFWTVLALIRYRSEQKDKS